MKADFINPFLSSSIQVIETIISVKPVIGQLQVKEITYLNHYIWLKINILGQVNKEIVFGFPEQMDKNMVSKMLGGYNVTEMDDICQSAVAELGNMISGNASTMLYLNGIEVDITPPSVINETGLEWGRKAFSIPLQIEQVGNFDIHIMV